MTPEVITLDGPGGEPEKVADAAPSVRLYRLHL